MFSNRTLKTINVKLCVLLMIAALLLAGCSSSGGSSGSSDAGYSTGGVSDRSGDEQTAPMPEHVITEGEILGYWTTDETEDEPTAIQFYKDGGELKYRMFAVVLGDGSGIGLANGHSIFEYNDGIASLNGEAGTIYCDVGNGPDVYISFYCFDADQGVITDQYDGKEWYRWDSFPYEDLVAEHYNY